MFRNCHDIPIPLKRGTENFKTVFKPNVFKTHYMLYLYLYIWDEMRKARDTCPSTDWFQREEVYYKWSLSRVQRDRKIDLAGLIFLEEMRWFRAVQWKGIFWKNEKHFDSQLFWHQGSHTNCFMERNKENGTKYISSVFPALLHAHCPYVQCPLIS